MPLVFTHPYDKNNQMPKSKLSARLCCRAVACARYYSSNVLLSSCHQHQQPPGSQLCSSPAHVTSSQSSSSQIRRENQTVHSAIDASKEPAWRVIMECIQEAVQNVHDAVPWRKLCHLWRLHFPVASNCTLLNTLEEELISGHGFGREVPERVPHDLFALPVFVQALCAAVLHGQGALETLQLDSAGTASSDTNNIHLPKIDKALLTSILAELRILVFYLTRERLIHVLRAMREWSVEEEVLEEAEGRASQSASVVSVEEETFGPIPSREKERVSHLGVLLTAGELQKVVMLMDAAVAVSLIDPPVTLLPFVYRLFLPALSACEQLDTHRLGTLATAVARVTDFDDPGATHSVADVATSGCPSTSHNVEKHDEDHIAGRCERSESVGRSILRPTMTTYSVLSHLNAIARALELQMSKTISCFKPTSRGLACQKAKLSLLSLKERKALEDRTRQQSCALCEDGPPVSRDALFLFEDVSVVCSALASRRYADDRFWNAVTEFTVTVVELTPHSEVLANVRNILFALDYVRHRASYDRVMSLLVRLGLVAQAVPPPSARREAMKEIKGLTAATLQQKAPST
ncbi:hypothetical protein TRVL_06946 [Trypanosoma vivax]|nr:hypothetical protein TRVL_06946 [Trypanosoma vivax]